MQLPPERPAALLASFALIRAASQIVPARERSYFQDEWKEKLFHRWRFLADTGLWNKREACRLFVQSFWAIPNAVQHFGAQDWVQRRVSSFVQSPFTCLGALVVLLALITLFSGGLPATRNLLFKQIDHDTSKLVYVWVHNMRGGGDRPLPAEVVGAWKTHSKLISNASAFRAVHRGVQINGGLPEKRFVVITEPSFFQAMHGKPVAGTVNASANSVLLSYDAWVQLFRASPSIIGHNVTIEGQSYPICGILPAGFSPLSRQMAIYLVEPRYLEQDAYAAVTARPGVTAAALDHELTDIAENVAYYFLQGQVRYGFAQSGLWVPVRSFAGAALASAMLLLLVFRFKWRSLWHRPKEEKAWIRRSVFFLAKTVLGLICVFTGCLEWSRSTKAILFGNFDPASGPFLLWLYTLGTMGLLFWVAWDQKERCRECLQLLAFPVRMGSPGNILLDWSGIELCCTQGHGVLHVPHLAPSWAEETDHWIALDDSWQGIFGHKK